jgi:predicted DsbA family dithiol-disulfide isomerase
VHALVWSDYICPWAYLGRDRTALLQSLGVTVTAMPYELHPDLPQSGRAVRPDGRLGRLHAAIALECETAGLAFRAPTHVPNSRRALETTEVVRSIDATAVAALDAALFSAHFVDGLDIGDADVIDELVTSVGARASEVRALVDGGSGRDAVAASVRTAHEHGIAATPAWLFPGDFVLPGVQPRELFERVVARLRAQTE